jgi:hypothetical protein
MRSTGLDIEHMTERFREADRSSGPDEMHKTTCGCSSTV